MTATPGVQLVIGEAVAPDGVQQAVDGADKWWWQIAQRALVSLADTGRPFECYDLTLVGVADPDHCNHWGALFRSAHAAGLIEVHGYTQSRRPGRAGGLCRLWIGRR